MTGSGRIWRSFRARGWGVVALSAVLLFASIGVLAPVLAGGQPIVCRHEGRLYAPAVADVLNRVPLVGGLVTKPRPFSLPSFEARKMLDPAAFAVWPPIPYAPEETSGDILQPPTRQHWLGTDHLGRDSASRLVHGAASALYIAVISMGLAAAVGVSLGGIAGYYGGWRDAVISRLIETVMSFPVFFLILSLMVWCDPHPTTVAAVIAATRWTSIARYTRAEFLRLKTLDFVAAAHAAGAGPHRIIRRHLLPHALAPILVSVTFGMAQAILIEAGLSWLGFGIQEPQASWGNILRKAFDHLRDAPHLVYPPCVAIFLTVLVYNLLGEALRDALDPTTPSVA